jgi:hypothetical protein
VYRKSQLCGISTLGLADPNGLKKGLIMQPQIKIPIQGLPMLLQQQANQKPPETMYVNFSAEIIPSTTEALLATVGNAVNQGVKTVYLNLSTPGGQVMNGLNLYNVLRGYPIELITHNVGNVDSIGNTVFMAGSKRYACPHSTFMFHGVAAAGTDDNDDAYRVSCGVGRERPTGAARCYRGRPEAYWFRFERAYKS